MPPEIFAHLFDLPKNLSVPSSVFPQVTFLCNLSISQILLGLFLQKVTTMSGVATNELSKLVHSPSQIHLWSSHPQCTTTRQAVNNRGRQQQPQTNRQTAAARQAVAARQASEYKTICERPRGTHILPKRLDKPWLLDEPWLACWLACIIIFNIILL